MALSVGIAGRSEVADVGLCEWTNPEEFRSRFQAELPEGIRIGSVQITATNASRQPKELSYCVPLLPSHTLTQEGVRELLASHRAAVTRTREKDSKEVDVRRFLKAIRLEGDALHMLLSCMQEGTARPEEVLEALGCEEGRDYARGRIERTHVSLSPSR